MLDKKLVIYISSIMSLVANFAGDTSIFLKAIFALVVIDIVTGLICAKYYRFQDITTRRFVRKINELTAFGIGLCAFIFADEAFMHIGLSHLWGAKFFCASYTFYELFSILENLGDMGLPIASQIKELLKAKVQNNLNLEEKKDDKQE